LVSWGELFDLDSNPDTEEVKKHFYNTVHFPFGLPNRSGPNFKYPIYMKIRSGTIQSFEITGQQLSVSMFLGRSWSNVFNRIQREIPVRPGYAFAFNISELHRGKLSGYQEPVDSYELRLSNERLEILNIIGSTMVGMQTSPPLVYIEQGEVFHHYGIPDRIYAQFFTMGPMQDYDIRSLTRAVYHRYNVLAHEAGLDISCTFDKATAIFDFKVSLKQVPVPVQPAHQPSPAQPAHQPESQPSTEADPDDSFPYDYYESIGLIDSEGMVLVNTILGPVRTAARSEYGRIHLLEAGKNL